MTDPTDKIVAKGDSYVCSLCGDTFIASHEVVEVIAEAERNFGNFPEDAVPICDDCYRKFMNWFQVERPDLNGK